MNPNQHIIASKLTITANQQHWLQVNIDDYNYQNYTSDIRILYIGKVTKSFGSSALSTFQYNLFTRWK